MRLSGTQSHFHVRIPFLKRTGICDGLIGHVGERRSPTPRYARWRSGSSLGSFPKGWRFDSVSRISWTLLTDRGTPPERPDIFSRGWLSVSGSRKKSRVLPRDNTYTGRRSTASRQLVLEILMHRNPYRGGTRHAKAHWSQQPLPSQLKFDRRFKSGACTQRYLHLDYVNL